MTRLRISAAGFLGLVVAACCAWLWSYSRGTTARAAERAMQEEQLRGNFSGAVLVSRAGKILFQRAYGLADAERGIPNSIETRYLIGSITKSFTAILVMQLERERRLSLADSPCRYLEACPAAWQRITLRDLLSHSSGIFNYTESADFAASRSLAQSREQMLARMQSRPPGFPAGERFDYSNSNYYLLGIVIEAVTHETYERVLQRRILGPLGMNDTGAFHGDSRAAACAIGYRRDATRNYVVDPPMHESWSFAAGGLYSTLHDLLKFSDALATDKLLPKAVLETMWTPARGVYGYGFQVVPVSEWSFGKRLIEHSGRTPGFVTTFQRFVDSGVTVIALSNHLDATPPRVVRGLAAAAFDIPYHSAFERKPVQVSREVLERVAGSYELDGTTFTLFVRDGGLFGKLKDAPEIPVLFESESVLYVDGMEGAIIALDDGRGRIIGLSVPVRGSMRMASRVH